MWSYNSDFNKWSSTNDSLLKFDYDLLKQELQSTRFYSKCLSGATYLPINNFDNVYDILNSYKERNWFISTVGSEYSQTSIPPQHSSPILATTSNDYYNKYLPEYGLTLKNLFTPLRLIRDSIKNYKEVDVATTGILDFFNLPLPLEIDGVKLIDGHRVLVKDQITSVTLLSSIDPETYFQGPYKVVSSFGASVNYSYYNNENGIYVVKSGNLVRETDLDDYKNCIRYSVNVKSGITNQGLQFHLSRLNNGYFPTTLLNQPLEFLSKKNWILRNRVDYNNLFEINYYDIYAHGTQSYTLDGFSYSIPQRTLSIGEFGIILNTQEGKSNIISNKYKSNLRGIAETSKYYWICGDEGILLKVTKHNFFIERVQVDCSCPRGIVTTSLKSVSFFDDLRGVAVGQLNTILYTKNSGLDWERIRVPQFDAFNFNKVIHISNTKFVVGGDAGIFLEFTDTANGWNVFRRRIAKFNDIDDDYLLVDNINDLYYTTAQNWNLTYSYFTQSIPTNKELVFIVTNGNNLIAYDFNNSFETLDKDFIYFDFGADYGDIRNITRRLGTNDFYFTGTDVSNTQDGLFKFSLNNFNYLGTGGSYSNVTFTNTLPVLVDDIYANEIYDYKGEKLFICGNESLLLGSTYSPVNFVSLDSSFEDKLKSKLLILDYDIASKLNFFTDAGDYRLPSTFTFSNVTLCSATTSFSFNPIVKSATYTNNGTYSENNWLTYWKDTQKTFKFYNNSPLDESTKVEISTTFSYIPGMLSSSFSTTGVMITSSASQMSYLAPMITYSTQSRYDSQALPSISAPTVGYDIYLYDYLMVVRVPTLFTASVGDMIRLDSEVVTSDFMINRIETFGSFPNVYNYLYLYTEFNQNIIKQLTSVTSSIVVSNLNKFDTLDNFYYRFNNHPISNGYKIDYIDTKGDITTTGTSSIFQVTPQFNNLTSYYNLQTQVDITAPTIIETIISTFSFNGGVSFSTNYSGFTSSFILGLSASVPTPVVATGPYGSSPNGTPALASNLANPQGVDYFPYQPGIGELYVAEKGSHKVKTVQSGLLLDYAGNGLPGYNGDGGPATFASIADPTDVCFDQIGNLYIATDASTTGDHVVRIVDKFSGFINTFAGNGLPGYNGDGGFANFAQLDTPRSVCHANNKIYIADSGNHAIREVDLASNVITTIAGGTAAGFSGDTGLAIYAQLNNPVFVDVESSGKYLYIADAGNRRIRVVDLTSGIIDTFAGNGFSVFGPVGVPAAITSIGEPSSVATDMNGNVYFSSYDLLASYKIFKVTQLGIISTVEFGSGNQVTVEHLNSVAVSPDDPSNPQIVYSTGGSATQSLAFPPIYPNRIMKVTCQQQAQLSSYLYQNPLPGDYTVLTVNGISTTFSFVPGPIASGTQVIIGTTSNDTLLNLSSVIQTVALIAQYIDFSKISVNSSILDLFVTDMIPPFGYGDIPNNNNNWKLSWTFITTVLETPAGMTASLNYLPSNNNFVVVRLNGISTTYTFKIVASLLTEVQIGATINSTLLNLRTKILSTPAYTPLIATSSVIGNQLNIGLNLGFGSNPNNSSNWRTSFTITSGGNIVTTNYQMVYTDPFLKFGYDPQYNLLDYLNEINDPNEVNPKFYASKEYLAMPEYRNLPLGSLASGTVYFDTNGMTYSGGSFSMTGNKIHFGTGYSLEWQSLFLNTFVDVIIYGASTYTTEKLLILNKYFDSITNSYIIEFHKRLNFTLGDPFILNGGSVDIISRRKLYQISNDLQELNNIQRNKSKTHSWKDQGLFSFESYQNELNFKIPTDSYAKILMSDTDTIQQLSAIIYVDSKNELAMNITRLAEQYTVPILNTQNFGNKVYISCSQKHDLTTGDGAVLEFIGGTNSSQYLNPQYSGYHVITKINEYDFLTELDFGSTILSGNDFGYVKYTKQDPFFNYTPVDLIEVGVDLRPKQSIELSEENIKLVGKTYSLVDIDFSKYRFRLVDSLDLETLSINYPWILEAEISGAVIGGGIDNLIWYKGTWECGRWFGGTWQSGTWMSGDWYNGVWNSYSINDKILTVDVNDISDDKINSTWFDGRWYDGTWNNGTWNNGRWYGGTWSNGNWYRGIWNDGTWNNGSFNGGIWVLGTWNGGVFNTDVEPAYWIDGKWYGGDFENGIWYNGLFEQKNSKARFGTKSFNSRTSTWHAGKWIGGSFYSSINYDSNNQIVVSDVHKYSIWRTGQWLSGEFYGGIAYNMDFKTGTWYGGILDEIQIIGIDTTEDTFTLNGIFKFNIGDEITVLDNQTGSTYSVFGSNDLPRKYKVIYQKEDTVNKRTVLYLSTELSSIGTSISSPVETKLRIVSVFRNADWQSGIWTNGIFDSGFWGGGIWYNGVFKGTWM